MTPPDTPPPALTKLSEDERLFRNSVYRFADREIRPLVREMDEHAKIADGLIGKLFGLGVMGIEIPERFGGVSPKRAGNGFARDGGPAVAANLWTRSGEVAASGAQRENEERRAGGDPK